MPTANGQIGVEGSASFRLAAPLDSATLGKTVIGRQRLTDHMQRHLWPCLAIIATLANLCTTACKSGLDYPSPTDETPPAVDAGGTESPVEVDSGTGTVPTTPSNEPKPPPNTQPTDAGPGPSDPPDTGGDPPSGDIPDASTTARMDAAPATTQPQPSIPDSGPQPTTTPDGQAPSAPDGSSNIPPPSPLKITAISPAPSAPDVSTATHFSLTFDAAIALGSGAFEIVDANTSAVFETVSAGDSRVQVSGKRMTVDIDGVLAGDTSYSVMVEAGMVVGTAGEPFAGISLGEWEFQTTSVELPVATDDLLVWLDASFTEAIKEQSGAVSLLPDRSAHHNDFVQTTSAARPQLVTNQVGGNAVVRFDGSNDVLLGPNLSDPAEYDLWVVWQSSVAPGSELTTIFNNGVLEGVHAQFTYGHSVAEYKTAIVSSFANDYQAVSFGTPVVDTPYIWNASYADAVMDAYLDGAPVGANSAMVDPLDSTPERAALGASDAGEYAFAGDVGEVLFFARALDTAERDLVEAYLGAKWGIAIDP